MNAWRRRAKASRPRRRGVALAILLAALLVVAMLLSAIVTGLALLSREEARLQGVCDAAALAGAAVVLDAPDVAARAAARPSHGAKLAAPEQLAAAAREAALAYSQTNAGRDAIAPQNVRVGVVADPSAPHPEFAVWTGVGTCNSVSIGLPVDRHQRNVLMPMFRLLMVDPGAVAACGTMDTRILGYRPTELVEAPVVPLMLPPRVALAARADTAALAGQADDFTVDPRTETVSAGADRIAEIVLEIAVSSHEESSVPRLVPLRFGLAARDIPRQIRRGFSPLDLSTRGRELALDPATGVAEAEAVLPTSTAAVGVLVAALAEIRGQERAWPVGTLPNPQVGRVEDFWAGQVVDIRVQDEQAVQVVVQPCFFHSPTALTHASRPPNPGLGKLVLTH